MIVERVKLRDFRSYERLELELPRGISVFHGANGAGKTNLLEAIYTGSVGRSCRTNVDSRAIRFGGEAARVELSGSDAAGPHRLAVGIARGQPKSLSADGVAVNSLDDFEWRPLVAVFMPDRLELVKGAPGVRRAHFDQAIAALWPARRADRQAYAAALAQRNALVARGDTASAQLDAWDQELARHGLALMGNRAALVDELAPRVAAAAPAIGLESEVLLRYKPSAKAAAESEFVELLHERRASDAQRGFTMTGPHRDEFELVLGERELRTYGSQGQQRAGLLALLLAECEALTDVTGRAPLVLLDDVMSELDGQRRERLIAHVGSLAQCVVTTTDLAYVPDLSMADATFRVAGGTVKSE